MFQLYNGKILYVDGKIAMHEDCCCSKIVQYRRCGRLAKYLPCLSSSSSSSILSSSSSSSSSSIILPASSSSSSYSPDTGPVPSSCAEIDWFATRISGYTAGQQNFFTALEGTEYRLAPNTSESPFFDGVYNYDYGTCYWAAMQDTYYRIYVDTTEAGSMTTNQCQVICTPSTKWELRILVRVDDGSLWGYTHTQSWIKTTGNSPAGTYTHDPAGTNLLGPTEITLVPAS